MAATLTLRSTYHRRVGRDPHARDASDWFGTFDIELVATDADAHAATTIPDGARLALWCAMLLEPTDESGVRAVDRLAGHLVLEPVTAGAATASIELPWHLPGLRARFPARHANDGPEAAWLALPDGSFVAVDVEPATASQPPSVDEPSQPPERISDRHDPDRSTISVVPHPRSVVLGGSPVRHRRAQLAEGGDASVRTAWSAVADLGAALGIGVLAPTGDDASLTVTIVLDTALTRSEHALAVRGGEATITASNADGVRYALITLSQLLVGGVGDVTVADEPAMPVRVVHLDLARCWYEPEVVERLIHLAAWRKLSHVHLHLTDDEAWRFSVDGYPALAAIGGTRGHGLPLPPLCGSGPEPFGRAYTDAEIARWVDGAHRLGLTLVPEVDVPAHCHAALIAVPELRDPDDTSTAMSVQGYPNNVLVPGRSTTAPFLEAVFTTLADRFAHSPTIHVGGDEVPTGAWSGSPAAQAYAQRRGLTSTADIEASFHRELIDMITSTTGRGVAMWEEAAFGGVAPAGDAPANYAVAWTSADAGVRLARLGHPVVVAPGQAYYLDMAPGRRWEVPGGSWAGNVSLRDTCEFDPSAGWPAELRSQLLGVQACLWGEHIDSVEILDQLAFPRLDAVAERGWTGRIIGGPSDLAERSALLPTFAT